MDERRRVILLPVRRRLAVLACAYLAGVYLAQIAAFPAVWIGFLCAFSAVLGLFRLRRRKSAFFCVALALFLLGNGVTASVLAVRDAPSGSKAEIIGEIDAIERENRVWLKNATCDGETRSRRMLVTLMAQKDEAAPAVQIGASRAIPAGSTGGFARWRGITSFPAIFCPDGRRRAAADFPSASCFDARKGS